MKAIREIVNGSKSDSPTIDPHIRDVLLFSAIIDIYETLEQLQPVHTFYQISIYISSALGISILALLFGLLTGQMEIHFKP